jgi:ribonuclease HI/GNAT superfamily N-acetyltransferase
MLKKVIIFTDGASRNNPGPAAIGVVLQDETGKRVAEISRFIGTATNNQAEYQAIIAALEKAMALAAQSVELRADSELVVKQLKGEYRVRNAELKPLFSRAQALSRTFSSFSIKYIPREQNSAADWLANQAFENRSLQPPGAQTTFIVRQATAPDYPALYTVFAEMDEIHARALPCIFKKVDPRQMVEHLASEQAQGETMLLLVAEDRGKMVGFIRLKIERSPDNPLLQPRRYAKINDLGVTAAYRRRGVEQMLMRAAEKWAGEQGIEEIELNVWEFNRAAAAFYQSLGFETARRTMLKKISRP